MTAYTLTKTFKNYYLKKEDTIELTYQVFKGFDTIEDAKKAVLALQQEPRHFLYITFQKQIYAVSVETIKQQVVIGLSDIYLINQSSREVYSRTTFDILPFTIQSPRVRSYWSGDLSKDLMRIEGEPLSFKCDNSLFNQLSIDCAFNTLGAAFFQTQVPVYQLNCLDTYVKQSLTYQDLWAQGVKAINPFHGKVEYTNAPFYSLDTYCKERQQNESSRLSKKPHDQ